MNFEKKLTRLEDIVGKMEKGDLGLDESLKLFEEGVKLSRECQSLLSEAEAKVQQLVGIGADGTPEFKDFTGTTVGPNA